jgi:hypothetical protein
MGGARHDRKQPGFRFPPGRRCSHGDDHTRAIRSHGSSEPLSSISVRAIGGMSRRFADPYAIGSTASAITAGQYGGNCAARRCLGTRTCVRHETVEAVDPHYRRGRRGDRWLGRGTDVRCCTIRRLRRARVAMPPCSFDGLVPRLLEDPLTDSGLVAASLCRNIARPMVVRWRPPPSASGSLARFEGLGPRHESLAARSGEVAWGTCNERRGPMGQTPGGEARCDGLEPPSDQRSRLAQARVWPMIVGCAVLLRQSPKRVWILVRSGMLAHIFERNPWCSSSASGDPHRKARRWWSPTLRRAPPSNRRVSWVLSAFGLDPRHQSATA